VSYDSSVSKHHDAQSPQLNGLWKRKLEIHLAYDPQLWQLCLVLAPECNPFSHFCLGRKTFVFFWDRLSSAEFEKDTNLCILLQFDTFSNQWLTPKRCCVIYSTACFLKQPHRTVILLLLPTEPTCNISSQSDGTHRLHK